VRRAATIGHRVRTTPLVWMLLASCLVGLGCSSLGRGGKGGGGENLPNRGVAGYQFDADSEMPAWLDLQAGDDVVSSPSAHPVDDGVVLYFEQHDGESSRVLRAELDDAGTPRAAPAEVLGSDVVDGGPRGASALRLDSGETWLVFGERDELAIYGAQSQDGLTFEPDADPWLRAAGPSELGGIGHPALVQDADGGLVLFYQARTIPDEDERQLVSIHAAYRAAGEREFVRTGPVLQPGTDCLDDNGEPTACWDARVVGEPDVRVGTTSEGRTVWRLGYTGKGFDAQGIGFAFSWDGQTWSRYPYNPSVTRRGSALAGPSNLRRGSEFLLFVTELRDEESGISMAVSDFGAASETF